MSSSPLSHYALLSLPPSATPEQIRSSYLRLAKDLHPDRAAPERRREATETFQALAEAYRVLSDPALRTAYDATLSLSLSLPLSHSAARAPPPPPRHPASPPRFDPHYGPSHSYRAAPDPGSSPFPGFRVPPGGYPSQPSVQGMEEVEHGADGSVRWRGESVTVMYGPQLTLSYPPSAGRTSAHARALPPPPPPSPHRPPCRAASPARGAQLALAAHAHAHASPVVGAWSPSAVPRGRPRRASGGAGMGLARQEQQQGVVRADSPLFG
ncbi:hypothetical protein DMC30DRAFT_413298 [Rhodotorula diobovata]|uniref:J domain-containing protein n=1 Tax=Rhodotorula diobovata TaxID=5288 RepID=A0A5C5G5K8_9BASI|nr:hypothetical protein DMC30DRAFT_413298 [Rhodotorula diobovata]